MSNGKELWIARRTYQRLDTAEREEGQRDRKRETGGGRMQCFMKKEDTCLIDVENVETTGERCCHLSWRTPLNSSLCRFI